MEEKSQSRQSKKMSLLGHHKKENISSFVKDRCLAYLDGSLSFTERHQFEKLLSNDDNNVNYFKDLKKQYETLTSLIPEQSLSEESREVLFSEVKTCWESFSLRERGSWFEKADVRLQRFMQQVSHSVKKIIEQ